MLQEYDTEISSLDFLILLTTDAQKAITLVSKEFVVVAFWFCQFGTQDTTYSRVPLTCDIVILRDNRLDTSRCKLITVH